MNQNTATIILAAGKGTRMKSNIPKVLHKIANKSMINHVIDACVASDITVVIGPDMPEMIDAVAPHKTAIQQQQLGTGDAVKAAQEVLKDHDGYVFILNGDGPFITSETLNALYQSAQQTGLAVLGCDFEDPSGYGRFVIKDDFVTEIIEEKILSD